LLAYFSRAGENYHHGGRRDLTRGNTEVLATMIAELTQVDLHRIEASDPYPHDYDATVSRNVTEQNDDAQPDIANPLASIDGYSTVLLASPIWNVRAPMIMSTFTETYDFTGKTVLPVVTSAVSGLGSVERDHATTRPRDCVPLRPDQSRARRPRRGSQAATQPSHHRASGRRPSHPLTHHPHTTPASRATDPAGDDQDSANPLRRNEEYTRLRLAVLNSKATSSSGYVGLVRSTTPSC